VNYQPSRLQPREEPQSARYSQLALSGSTQQAKIQREQNFKQAGDLYRSFSQQERQDLIDSFGGSWRPPMTRASTSSCPSFIRPTRNTAPA
jgi:catalase